MLSKTKEKVFGLVGHSLNLLVSVDELFMPNQVTKEFTKAVKINQGDVVFDIGSGVGPLAIWSGYEPSSRVYGVEIVPEQCEGARENVRRNKLQDKVEIYEGSFFDPLPENVKNEKADVIIADLSGISEKIARVLGWYPVRIPTGGRDGTDVINSVLEKACKYLKEGGRLYFPIAGLSCYKKIMEKSILYFNSLVEKINANFPLTYDQVESINRLELHSSNYELKSKGTRTIWKGWIFEAKNPILR